MLFRVIISISNTLLPHRLRSSPYNSEMTLANAILLSSKERRKVYLQHQRKNSISVEDVLRADQVTYIYIYKQKIPLE